MKSIQIILILLFSITFISATTIYSGEQQIIPLEKEFTYYSIVGNSTPIDLEIEMDGLNAVVTFGKYINDSFEIVFFDRDKETVTVYQSSSSGGSSSTKWKTEYVDRNITKYIDKEIIKEIPGETVEVEIEKLTNKTSWWIWGLIGLLILVLIYMAFSNKTETRRRYEENE